MDEEIHYESCFRNLLIQKKPEGDEYVHRGR